MQAPRCRRLMMFSSGRGPRQARRPQPSRRQQPKQQQQQASAVQQDSRAGVSGRARGRQVPAAVVAAARRRPLPAPCRAMTVKTKTMWHICRLQSCGSARAPSPAGPSPTRRRQQ